MINKIISDNKNSPEQFQGSISSSEDSKDTNAKYNLSKFEYDLYHEEDDVSLPVVRVKNCSLPNNGEKWKIMIDNKITFVLEGSKISKKEKEFLHTIEGFNFLLTQARAGIKSLNNLKKEMDKIISDKNAKTETFNKNNSVKKSKRTRKK